MVTVMAALSKTPQQYQQLIDRISELETRMVTLHSHAEAQHIRGSDPTATGSGDSNESASTVSTKYTGNPSECKDWSFSARRVLTRVAERFGGLLQWISAQVDEVKESDVLEYRRTTDLSTTDLEWFNLELYALLAIETSDRHWHPSSRSRKLKSKESSAGNDWSVRHEISPASRGASHGVGDAPRKSAEGHRPPTGIPSMGKQIERVSTWHTSRTGWRREGQSNETYDAEGDIGSSGSSAAIPHLCGRCVSSDEEIGQCHVTCEHKHSHDNKGHNSCSNGCVSDEFEPP